MALNLAYSYSPESLAVYINNLVLKLYVLSFCLSRVDLTEVKREFTNLHQIPHIHHAEATSILSCAKHIRFWAVMAKPKLK